jgi:U3 small nucleolar RNA-associated protein 15
VKTGMFNPASGNIIVTGGYDHTILVWDVRSGSRVCKLNQGVPIESLTVLPDGGSVVAAGTTFLFFLFSSPTAFFLLYCWLFC